MSDNYNENSIVILEGLEAVRKRPGMYIGTTDVSGLHHLIWEVVDNSIDEALNGHGNRIIITLNKNGSCSVEDFGRGMPVGKHISGKSALEVIFTILHAGGKFSATGGYKTAGGLHGVGASVVNALSKKVLVEVNTDGYHYSMEFTNGGKKVGELVKGSKTNKTGSKVTFFPDETIFSTTKFNFKTICTRCREQAFLLNNITIEVNDLIADKQEIFHYQHGLLDFLEYLHEDRNALADGFVIRGESNGITVDCAFQYTDDYQDNTYSFVNLVRTKEGGTHETGFKTAFTKSINDFSRKNSVLKEKDKNFEGVDIREGLTAIISVGIPENLLQFEGQTKSKLGTIEAKAAVDAIVSERLNYYLEENRETSLMLVRKIQRAQMARKAARKAREDLRKGKSLNKTEKVLSGKLAAANTKDSRIKELFLVEGDSAGGSAKQGRDSKYQAILPLRGKVLNTEKAQMSDIEKNVELNTIVHALGAGIGPSFDFNACNYHKVVIMTDADTDGAHIQILLLTFFYRYMKPLIENGMVYIALPPLFKITVKKKTFYAYTENDLLEIRKEYGNQKLEIQRYKGLGEMNADQLWETTMSPETRTLIQVSIDDAISAGHLVSVLMGDKPNLRREWIEDNINFSLEDNFEVVK